MRDPAHRKETLVRPKQGRKNPLPTRLEAQGEGLVLIVDGEPKDRCPVTGCTGTLLFLHR
jgi:hypothetical protein